MKYLKLFEDYNSKKDTRLVSGVKANDVVNYFEENDFYNIGAEFIDFDTVELTVFDSDDMDQDEIEEKLDGAENTIFSAHLQSDVNRNDSERDFDDFEDFELIPDDEEREPDYFQDQDDVDPAGGHGLRSYK